MKIELENENEYLPSKRLLKEQINERQESVNIASF